MEAYMILDRDNRTQPTLDGNALESTLRRPGDEEPVENSYEGNRHEIAALAYSLWQQRGCPDGTAEEDWFRAEQELASKNSDR